MTAILDEELHSGNKIGCLLYLIEKDKRLSRNYRHAANQRETRDEVFRILCFRKNPNGLLVLQKVHFGKMSEVFASKFSHDISFSRLSRSHEQKGLLCLAFVPAFKYLKHFTSNCSPGKHHFHQVVVSNTERISLYLCLERKDILPKCV